MANLLLDAKAEADSKDDWGWTPLSYPARNGHLEVAKLLLDAKAEIESKDNYRRRPLLWAARNDRSEAVRLLLDVKAKVEMKDHDGLMALQWAAGGGPPEVVLHASFGKISLSILVVRIARCSWMPRKPVILRLSTTDVSHRHLSINDEFAVIII